MQLKHKQEITYVVKFEDLQELVKERYGVNCTYKYEDQDKPADRMFDIYKKDRLGHLDLALNGFAKWGDHLYDVMFHLCSADLVVEGKYNIKY